MEILREIIGQLQPVKNISQQALADFNNFARVLHVLQRLAWIVRSQPGSDLVFEDRQRVLVAALERVRGGVFDCVVVTGVIEAQRIVGVKIQAVIGLLLEARRASR